MGFLDKIKDSIEERRERRKEQGREQQEREDYVNRLLAKFEIPDLDKFLMRYLNDKPESREEERDDGRIYTKRPTRKKYIAFVWKHLEKEIITPNHLKDFALKNKLVSPSFFDDPNDSQHEKGDFEEIVSSIKAYFEPEKITNEEHLESQLVIFLKAKFPERKIRRQVTIQGGDVLDILIDDTYVLELKVPRIRSDLRNLGAQVEEYSEMYPNICAIVFDDLEANLSQDIMDYTDKYRRDNGIQSIIIGGQKR